MRQGTPLRSPRATAAVALAFLFAAAATQPVAAQPDNAAELCTPDVMRLCGEFIPDRDRIVVCLKAKIGELSPGCRGVMAPARIVEPAKEIAAPATAGVTAKVLPSPKAKKKKSRRRRHPRHPA